MDNSIYSKYNHLVSSISRSRGIEDDDELMRILREEVAKSLGMPSVPGATPSLATPHTGLGSSTRASAPPDLTPGSSQGIAVPSSRRPVQSQNLPPYHPREIQHKISYGAIPAMAGVVPERELTPGTEAFIPHGRSPRSVQVPVRVVRAKDPDTLMVRFLSDKDSDAFPIRYFDIDAPEKNTPLGNVGNIPFPAQELEGKVVIWNRGMQDTRGAHGRRLGTITSYDPREGTWESASRPIQQEGRPEGIIQEYGESFTKAREEGLPFVPVGEEMRDPNTVPMGRIKGTGLGGFYGGVRMASDLAGFVTRLGMWIPKQVGRLALSGEPEQQFLHVINTPAELLEAPSRWATRELEEVMARVGNAKEDFAITDDSMLARIYDGMKAVDYFNVMGNRSPADWNIKPSELSVAVAALGGELADVFFGAGAKGVKVLRSAKKVLDDMGKQLVGSVDQGILESMRQTSAEVAAKLDDARAYESVTDKYFASGTAIEASARGGALQFAKTALDRAATRWVDVTYHLRRMGGERYRAMDEMVLGAPEASTHPVNGIGNSKLVINDQGHGKVVKTGESFQEAMIPRPLDHALTDKDLARLGKKRSPRNFTPVSPEEQMDVDIFLGLQRNAIDLPRVIADEAAAAKRGEMPKGWKPREGPTPEQIQEDIAAMRHILRKYSDERKLQLFGLMDENFSKIRGRVTDNSVIERVRQWSAQSTLGKMVEVNAKSQKWYDETVERWPHFAPYERMTVEFLKELGGEQAIKLFEDDIFEAARYSKDPEVQKLYESIPEEIREYKKQLPRGEQKAFGPHPGELGGTKTPMTERLSAALSLEEKIGSPMEAMIRRSNHMHLWSQRQLAKNELMKGIMGNPALAKKVIGGIDDLGRRTHGYEIYRTTGRQRHQALSDVQGTEFPTYELKRGKDGKFGNQKETWFIPDSSFLIDGINKISAPRMLPLARFIQNHPVAARIMIGPTNIFRKGVTLGLSFAQRNWLIDTFSHSIYNQYGYIPLIKPWQFASGFAHVIAKSPTYQKVMGMGGAGASILTDNKIATSAKMTDALERMGLRDTLWEFFKETSQYYGKERASAFLQRMWEGRSDVLKSIGAGRKTFMRQAREQNKLHRGILAKRVRGEKLTPKDRVTDFFMDFASQPLYGFHRITEILEESNRMGGALVARNRMGQKAIDTSIDEALGGIAGIAKMIHNKEARKGVVKRWREARKGGKLRRKDYPEMSDIEFRDFANKKLAEYDLLMARVFRGRHGGGTVDFSQKGSRAEVMNSMYPFFNVDLLDMNKFMRRLRDYPISTLLRAYTFITIPTIVNWFANIDDPTYQQLSQTNRDLNYTWFTDPETGRSFQTPRVRGWLNAWFGHSVEAALDELIYRDPKALAALEREIFPGLGIGTSHPVSDILDNLKKGGNNPVDLLQKNLSGNAPFTDFPGPGQLSDPRPRNIQVAGSKEATLGTGYAPPGDPNAWRGFLRTLLNEGPGKYLYNFWAERQDKEGKRMAGAITPQALGWFTGIYTNYNWFFDSQVVPRSMYGENFPGDTSMVHTSSTSPTLRMVHGVLPEHLKRMRDVNPITMEYFVRKQFASVGATVLRALDTFLEMNGLAPEDYERLFRDPKTNPAVQGYWSRPSYGPGSEGISDFYTALAKTQETARKIKRYEKLGKPDKMFEVEASPEGAAPAMFLQGVGRDLSQIWDMVEWIRAQPFTDAEKEFYIGTMYMNATQLAQAAVNVYRAYESDPERFRAGWKRIEEVDPAELLSYELPDPETGSFGDMTSLYRLD